MTPSLATGSDKLSRCYSELCDISRTQAIFVILLYHPMIHSTDLLNSLAETQFQHENLAWYSPTYLIMRLFVVECCVSNTNLDLATLNFAKLPQTQPLYYQTAPARS